VWEGSSAVTCGAVEWNVLIGRLAVQWAAVQMSDVLSGRVAVEWAAVQLSGKCCMGE